jgi:hypothetical protein
MDENKFTTVYILTRRGADNPTLEKTLVAKSEEAIAG